MPRTDIPPPGYLLPTRQNYQGPARKNYRSHPRHHTHPQPRRVTKKLRRNKNHQNNNRNHGTPRPRKSTGQLPQKEIRYLDFEEKLSTMVTRTNGIHRISKVAIANDAIPPDTHLTRYMLHRKFGTYTAHIIYTICITLIYMCLGVLKTTKNLLPYATFLAICAILIGKAEAAEKVTLNKNWIYRNRGSANLNPEIIMLMKTYTPCDMQELIINLEESLHRNKELCNRQFPTTIDRIQYINASTATGNYVTLQGRLTITEAKVRCATIGTSLVTAKTSTDAERLYQYMAHHLINETFADITINTLNMEPTFWSDGSLANGKTTFAKKVKSTNSYYREDKTWEQVVDQVKKSNQAPIFTYGITTALNVAVYMHRENAPYSKTASGGVGTTLRLTSICNSPDNEYEQPEITNWRSSCKLNLKWNRRVADSIKTRINNVMPNNLPQTTQPYPSLIKLNSEWDDKTKTSNLLNIIGRTFDPAANENKQQQQKPQTTPFRMVKDSIVEQAEMTISGKCANWLADRKTDGTDKQPYPTAAKTIKPITDPCNENPISVNINTNLYGCEGAVYQNSDPAQEYCEGGHENQYVWYKQCCTWTGRTCARNPDIHSNVKRYAQVIPAIVSAAKAGWAMAKLAWPAISVGTTVGQFLVELKPDDDDIYDPNNDQPTATSEGNRDTIGFHFLFEKYRTLQAASFAFSEATHLDTLFTTTIHQAEVFSKDFHKAIVRVAHTATTPKVTDFMSIDEFAAIRNNLVTKHQVLTPTSMKTTKLRLITTKNTYFLLFSMPRETDTSLVDIYQQFPLPIFKNGKKYQVAAYTEFFALTSKGTQVTTQLSTSEAEECITTGVCEASHPTLPMNKAPCGINAIHDKEDTCTWIEAQGMDPEFITIDSQVYYAIPPNTSITMEIRCRGFQNRGLNRQSLNLEEGYGQFSFQSPECSGHYNGMILSPSRRSINIDQWDTTKLGIVRPSSPNNKQNKDIHVAKRYQFPDKWSLVAKLGIAAGLALILGVLIMCGMGHLCPVAVMACATPFRIMDIARLYRRHHEHHVNPPAAHEQVALHDQVPELIDIEQIDPENNQVPALINVG